MKTYRMNPEFQRTAREIVNAHVTMNVTPVINELSYHNSPIAIEEIADLAYTLDHSSALIESGEARWDEILEQWISNDDNAERWDDAQVACEALDIDPHERETLEYWVVDSWLAEQLRKQGENVESIVEFDWYVWGRTTSGQAISIDSCIEQITERVLLTVPGGGDMMPGLCLDRAWLRLVKRSTKDGRKI